MEPMGESQLTSLEVSVATVSSTSPLPAPQVNMSGEGHCSENTPETPSTSPSGMGCVDHDKAPSTSPPGMGCVGHDTEVTTTPAVPEPVNPSTAAHIEPQCAAPPTLKVVEPSTNTSQSIDTSPPQPGGSSGLDASLATTDSHPSLDASVADGRPSLDASLSIADDHPSLNTSLSTAEGHPDLNASLPTGEGCPDLNASLSMADSRPSLDALSSAADSRPRLDALSSAADSRPSLDASSSTADSRPGLDASLSTADSHPSLDASLSTGNCHHPNLSTTPALPDVPAASRSSQSAPLADLSLNTYAQRNPSRPLIEPKHTTKKPKVDQMTKMLKQEAKEREYKALMAAVKHCIERREKEVADIAKAQGRTEQHIQRLVNDETHYHQKREVNLYNAKIHWKSRELNEDRSRGQRITLAEIRSAVDEDPTLGDDITEERKEELLAELKEYREVNAKGARVDNRAANHDYQHTVSQMNQEMSSLSLRTGAIGFAVFTRGHINDSIFSSWSTANGAEEFILETFGMTLGELGRKFDAWSVARSQKEEERPDSIRSLQSECSKTILEGLREKLNKPSVHMSYTNYDVDIKLAHHVRLRGWPKQVNFAPPSSITPKAKVLLLLDALKEGNCIWVSMTTQEIAHLKSELKDTSQRKTRAPRKDKGGTHNIQKGRKRKRNDENQDLNDDGPPAKKAKVRRKKVVQLPPQRLETPPPVDSSNDDSDGV